MAIPRHAFSVIVPAADANFSAHTYTAVYAGANASPTINGQAVTMVGGSTLAVSVKSISATANVFLLGQNIDVTDGTQIIGGSGTGSRGF